MEISIYKLQFNTPVHFGSGNLDDTEMTFRSDRLFSALLIEILKKNGVDGLNKIVNLVKNNKLYISDAMPFYDNGDSIDYFVVKPFTNIKALKDNEILTDEKTQNKKSLKKMKYLPISQIKNFLNGTFEDVENVNEKLKKIGMKNYVTKVYIDKEDNKPYEVSSFTFSENAGLYIVFMCETDEISSLFDELLMNVGLIGIGGERSSGYGKFNVKKIDEREDIYTVYKELINSKSSKYMTISSCLPNEDEIEKVLKNATYNLIRVGGFVDNSYSDIKYIKKKSFYYISSGACFEDTFEGSIYNVSFDNEKPIYRYAKPFLISVG